MYRNDRLATAQRYPIDEYERHILFLLEGHQVLVVVGETGSGKSTRIPQILFSAGIYNSVDRDDVVEEGDSGDPKMLTRPKHKQICITQPRRVAAVQLAQRVSHDLGCNLGSTVGYAIRFQDVTSHEHTMIKFVTEGILIRELLFDPLLKKYSVIILDEVHQRNLNTDILLGLLKCILVKRADLKLIICSATLDVDEITAFFKYNNQCPAVLSTKGKSYPVKIFYKKQPVANYLDASVESVRNIHESIRLASGKILVFLTSQDEVDYVCQCLKDYAMTLSNRLDVQQLLILPFYAALKPEDISKVFDEHGKLTRVCIVSTNIAETSLTINNIAYVVDCGFAKLKIYDSKSATDCLIRVPISKSSAKQRAGRAGRTREGVVYRLYQESDYNQLEESTMPEIQRSPLMETITLLMSLGVDDITRFPLISKMPKANLVSALELLYALQAIDEKGKLTSTGQLMTQFNLDPRVSKMLVSLESAGCTKDACKIAAILQVKDIYTKGGRYASSLWANQDLQNLYSGQGDMITYLKIMNSFLDKQKNKKWADRRNLNYQALLNASDIANKLEAQMRNCGLSITSSRGRDEIIQRAVASGLFSNAAYLHPNGEYKTVKGDLSVYVHPTSVYSNDLIERPKFVVFVEILNTTKPYMRHIMAVEQSWLLEIAPHYYTFATSLEMMRNKTR
uniref:Putative ATP-dependent RNA helicase DHX35 n=1 Tax=Aceria tosichella TaxID=561515 RepID=A0A6G1SKN6_9ACAR